MSLCSCSSCSTNFSSLKWNESSNSYRLLSSSSSSITTVSSQLDNQRHNSITDDDEQWPILPVHNNYRIEKNVNLKDQQLNKTGCILKATMTKEQIIIYDSSSTILTNIPGKQISMKVVFKL